MAAVRAVLDKFHLVGVAAGAQVALQYVAAKPCGTGNGAAHSTRDEYIKGATWCNSGRRGKSATMT